MNTLIVDFEILYLLESPEIIIIEIQRKDMDDRILSSDKFQWGPPEAYLGTLTTSFEASKLITSAFTAPK